MKKCGKGGVQIKSVGRILLSIFSKQHQKILEAAQAKSQFRNGYPEAALEVD